MSEAPRRRGSASTGEMDAELERVYELAAWIGGASQADDSFRSFRSVLVALLVARDETSNWFQASAERVGVDTKWIESYFGRPLAELRMLLGGGKLASIPHPKNDWTVSAQGFREEAVRRADSMGTTAGVRHLAAAYLFGPNHDEELRTWGFRRSMWAGLFIEMIRARWPDELQEWERIVRSSGRQPRDERSEAESSFAASEVPASSVSNPTNAPDVRQRQGGPSKSTATEVSSETFEFWQTVELWLQYAQAIWAGRVLEGPRVPEEKRPPLGPEHLFAAIVPFAERDRGNAVGTFARYLARIAGPSDLPPQQRAWAALGLKDPGQWTPLGPLPIRPSTHSPGLDRVFAVAAQLARSTTGSPQIHASHLLAALLYAADESDVSPPRARIREHGYNLSSFRPEFREFVRKTRPDDDAAAWDGILGGGQPASSAASVANAPPVEQRSVPSKSEASAGTPETTSLPPPRPAFLGDYSPGYLNDQDGKTDRLGIERDVNALSTLVADKRTVPPLAIGLFGDWGTGKSFFMDRMQERVKRCAERAREAKARGEETSYCSEIAQIPFNAWHYMDANLWASLVARILEGLSEHFSKDTKEKPEEARKRLMTKLDTMKVQLEEAQLRRERAAQELAQATKQFEDAKQKRKELEAKRVAARAASLGLRDALQDSEVRGLLDRVMSGLGLPKPIGSVRELERTATSARSFGERVSALFRRLFDRSRPWTYRLGIVFLLFVPPSAFVLAWWLAHGDFDRRWLFVPAGWLAALWGALSPHFAAIGRALDELEQADKRVAELADEERRQRAADELRLEAELNQVRDDARAAEQAVTQAEAHVAAVQQELDDIQAGRRFQKFIVERIASGEYQRQLGLIATIRRDFERLGDLLGGKQAEADEGGPLLVDRIVLYIDDLDRCPEERVVDVLQAIHLLLSFKLFVVVVGVDSRWLLQSLRKQYPALRGDELLAPLPDAERATWSVSTPQNYLEKIFQVPFSLRPMTRDGYSKLIEGLLPVSAGTSAAVARTGTIAEPSQSVAPPSEVAAALSRELSAAESPAATTDGTAAPAVAQTADVSATAETGVSEGRQASASGGDGDAKPPALDPAPPQLEVGAAERAFMQTLSAFIASPRAAKRFANTYRLLRASLLAEELPGFEGGEKPGDFHVVQLLLAVLCGTSSAAGEFFARLADANHAQTWLEFVGGLPDVPGEPGHAEAIDPELDRSHAEWASLLSGLRGSTDGPVGSFRVGRFQSWAARVTRYSFHVGRTTRRNGSPPAPRTAA